LNKDLQQFIGVCFEGLTDLDKFHDVDTPFAAFVFGNEGLRSMKAHSSRGSNKPPKTRRREFLVCIRNARDVDFPDRVPGSS